MREVIKRGIDYPTLRILQAKSQKENVLKKHGNIWKKHHVLIISPRFQLVAKSK